MQGTSTWQPSIHTTNKNDSDTKFAPKSIAFASESGRIFGFLVDAFSPDSFPFSFVSFALASSALV